MERSAAKMVLVLVLLTATFVGRLEGREIQSKPEAYKPQTFPGANGGFFGSPGLGGGSGFGPGFGLGQPAFGGIPTIGSVPTIPGVGLPGPGLGDGQQGGNP